MTELRTRSHLVKKGRIVVEIWEDGEFIGTVTPRHGGVNIVSKYLVDRKLADVAAFDRSERFPPDATGIDVLAVTVKR